MNVRDEQLPLPGFGTVDLTLGRFAQQRQQVEDKLAERSGKERVIETVRQQALADYQEKVYEPSMAIWTGALSLLKTAGVDHVRFGECSETVVSKFYYKLNEVNGRPVESLLEFAAGSDDINSRAVSLYTGDRKYKPYLDRDGVLGIKKRLGGSERYKGNRRLLSAIGDVVLSKADYIFTSLHARFPGDARYFRTNSDGTIKVRRPKLQPQKLMTQIDLEADLCEVVNILTPPDSIAPEIHQLEQATHEVATRAPIPYADIAAELPENIFELNSYLQRLIFENQLMGDWSPKQL